MLTVLFKVFSNPNPVVPHFINEFMFDTTGWKLELHSYYGDSLSLNRGILTSNTDTAYFNDGLYVSYDNYIVITQNDLQSHFDINRIDDNIGLHDSIGAMDNLSFGTSGYVSAPKTGQSINLLIYYDGPWQQYCYYLDNTPTFGFENDTLNAKGNIEGFVKDSLINPLEGVKVIYGYYSPAGGGSAPLYVETNSLGYFTFRDLTILKTFEFEKEGYFTPDTSIQIWPDSTVTINIQMQAVVGITELPVPPLNSFELSQNYPNPFNNSTSFNYSLSEDGFVEINIYDEKGELVQKLFNGNQTKGQYRVNWNADNLASGIYFYELKTREQNLSKKCLLLK